MLINSSVIVLKSFQYSDHSIIARCFSKDRGKISFIIKGAYSKKSSKFAQFQPLNYLDVVYRYNPNRELQILNKVNFKESWMNIIKDIRAITLSMTLLEITEKTLSYEDPHPNLFKSLLNVIRAFNNKQSDPNILFWFYECSLLSDMGFHPDLNKNNFPGIKVVDPNSAPNSGIILASLLSKNIEDLPTENITSKDRKVIGDYLWGLLTYHFEDLAKIKSMKVTRKILNDIKLLN